LKTEKQKGMAMQVRVNTSQTVLGAEYPGLPGYRLMERSGGRSVYKKFNPLTGVGSYLEFDHNTKKVTVGKIQDVQAIIDHNKARQNDFAGYGGKTFVRTHAVPMVVDAELKKKSGYNTATGDYDADAYKKLLNDSDYKYLKTVPGKI